MKRKAGTVAVAVAVAAAITWAVTPLQPEVEFRSGGEKLAELKVEVADTPEERRRGLMNREELAEGRGMIFVYSEPGYRSFWMKNTSIPLDIIFVGSEGKVLNIEQADPEPGVPDSELERYRSDGRALYVVEANQGFARRNGVEPGVEMEFRKYSGAGFLSSSNSPFHPLSAR